MNSAGKSKYLGTYNFAQETYHLYSWAKSPSIARRQQLVRLASKVGKTYREVNLYFYQCKDNYRLEKLS